MRRAAKVDANAMEIIRGLRRIGATVTPTHFVGHGFPDAIWGFRGRSGLLEIKVPGESLTEKEQLWHATWRGRVDIVHDVNEAIYAVTKEPSR